MNKKYTHVLLGTDHGAASGSITLDRNNALNKVGITLTSGPVSIRLLVKEAELVELINRGLEVTKEEVTE